MRKILMISLALVILLFSASCAALPFSAVITPSKSETEDVEITGGYDPAAGCCPADEEIFNGTGAAQEAPALPEPDEYEVILEPDPACGDLSECEPPELLPEFMEVTGTVKEVKEGLILISLTDDGGDFMLRFSENSKYTEGIDPEIEVGNSVKCLVKPEPTFAPPAQGEVFEVLFNQ